MFKYRPLRNTLEESINESKEFITMDQMFDFVVYEYKNMGIIIDKNDISISDVIGKDIYVTNWSEKRKLISSKINNQTYDIPQTLGYCSMEDCNLPEYMKRSKNIHIGGLSRYHLLKQLYDAAKPYDKIITLKEAADALHNTVDMITELKGKELYVNVFGTEFDGSKYDKINGIGLSYHIICEMRYKQLWRKHPWEQGIMPEQIEPKDDHSPILPFNYPSRLQEIFEKVSKNNKIPDEIIDKENKYDISQSLDKIEEDKREKLELFKNRMIAKLEPEFEELYKSTLVDSRISVPVQNVYKVTCNVGFDIDFILIHATDEREAWNKFWEHFNDEPNLNHEDLGSKEKYERVRGYWKKRGSTVSITIEPIHTTSDFLYIGGGRSV